MKYLMPVHLCKHLKACGVNTTTTKKTIITVRNTMKLLKKPSYTNG